MADIAKTPVPPYYAVIFTSLRVIDDGAEYGRVAGEMDRLAKEQPGYLGIESARGDDGLGITVSYWRDLESIQAWRAQFEHREAQNRGKSDWYREFSVRISRVESAHGFERPKN